MAEIGIEMITRGETTLEDVLVSLSVQSFKDFMIACVNSSGKDDISETLRKYGVKEIAVDPSTNFLEARYIAHINASGKYRLLLDSTRPLDGKALEILISNYKSFPAVCLREGSIGNGFWVCQADRLRLLSEASFKETAGKNVAYILPRFYHENVLDRSFLFLKENIDEKLFVRIGYGEHHLIYETANLKENEICITKEILMTHYEDTTARDIIKKYMRYGRSQRTLDKLDFTASAKKLASHKRPLSLRTLIPSIVTIPIRFLRISAFLLGYLL